MKIVMINIPFQLSDNEWITVPPKGYGGIQWIVKNLIDGLLSMGHHITLLGAPGSKVFSQNLEIIDIGKIDDIENWLKLNYGKYDIVHDHTCRGEEFQPPINWFNWKKIHSHYLSSMPFEKNNLVAASFAHAEYINFPKIPVVRHPVNEDNYLFEENKDDYLLFMGRVSRWKGVDLAASFAKKVEKKLIIAGPTWEKEYFDKIMNKYSTHVEYVGEVHGEYRKNLIARAKALLVFSRDMIMDNGNHWIEPGATVVSEAGISGTPIISSNNGCLKEIVPHVGVVIDNPLNISAYEAKRIINSLPLPQYIHDKTKEEWDYKKISKQYLNLYQKVLKGKVW